MNLDNEFLILLILLTASAYRVSYYLFLNITGLAISREDCG